MKSQIELNMLPRKRTRILGKVVGVLLFQPDQAAPSHSAIVTFESGDKITVSMECLRSERWFREVVAREFGGSSVEYPGAGLGEAEAAEVWHALLGQWIPPEFMAVVTPRHEDHPSEVAKRRHAEGVRLLNETYGLAEDQP